MFPYVLLKSVILVRMLKWNIPFPTHLCIPPIVTLKYITNQRNEDLLSFFNGIEDIYAVYWMGGLSPDLYIMIINVNSRDSILLWGNLRKIGLFFQSQSLMEVKG